MDWDNDGKLDLLAGDTKGNVWLFMNTGTRNAPVLAEGVRVQAAGKPIVGVGPKYEKGDDGRLTMVQDPDAIMGIYSKIHFGDWNGDGLKDLLVGQTSPSGHSTVFYKNIGTPNAPAFGAPEPLPLPDPPLSRPSPYLIDWDRDGVVDLLCGSERPTVFFFRNTGTNQSPRLESGQKIDLIGNGFEKSYRCRFDVTDWNEDGKLDMLVGNFFSQRPKSGGNIWLFLGK